MRSGSPVVDSALLTKDLRARRAARGEKQEDVARALDWSKSKFMRVEQGTVSISRADLELLLRHYGVTDDKMYSELNDLARGARDREAAWWSKKHSVSDKAFEAYLGYEAAATSIRMSQGLLVPGILQTPEYAETVTATYLPEEKVEGAVKLRLDRKERILKRGPQQIHVLDEAVIRRGVRGAMVKQLHHLIELSHRPEIEILVIPFSAGPHFGLRGPFVLLGFDVDLDTVLYLESARRGDLMIAGPDIGETISGSPGSGGSPRPDEIGEYEDGFESLVKLALSGEESRKLIEQAAQDMRSLG
jgi:transcriptional regulator with XRE-family HTH domain